MQLARPSDMFYSRSRLCSTTTQKQRGVLVPNAGGTRDEAASPRGKKKAKQPGQFEVKVVTPPSRSLGVHALPVNTHCGDMISVDDTDYVVQSLVVQFKLVRGRYQREHHRLDCMSASRFLLNRNLEHCFTKKGGRDADISSPSSIEEELIPPFSADAGPSEEGSSN